MLINNAIVNESKLDYERDYGRKTLNNKQVAYTNLGRPYIRYKFKCA